MNQETIVVCLIHTAEVGDRTFTDTPDQLQTTKQSPSRAFGPLPDGSRTTEFLSTEPFAEKMAGTFGCGGRVVVPYLGHYVARLIFTSIPEFLVASMMHGSARETVEKAMKWLKSDVVNQSYKRVFTAVEITSR